MNPYLTTAVCAFFASLLLGRFNAFSLRWNSHVKWLPFVAGFFCVLALVVHMEEGEARQILLLPLIVAVCLLGTWAFLNRPYYSNRDVELVFLEVFLLATPLVEPSIETYLLSWLGTSWLWWSWKQLKKQHHFWGSLSCFLTDSLFFIGLSLAYSGNLGPESVASTTAQGGLFLLWVACFLRISLSPLALQADLIKEKSAIEDSVHYFMFAAGLALPPALVLLDPELGILTADGLTQNALAQQNLTTAIPIVCAALLFSSVFAMAIMAFHRASLVCLLTLSLSVWNGWLLLALKGSNNWLVVLAFQAVLGISVVSIQLRIVEVLYVTQPWLRVGTKILLSSVLALFVLTGPMGYPWAASAVLRGASSDALLLTWVVAMLCGTLSAARIAGIAFFWPEKSSRREQDLSWVLEVGALLGGVLLLSIGTSLLPEPLNAEVLKINEVPIWFWVASTFCVFSGMALAKWAPPPLDTSRSTHKAPLLDESYPNPFERLQTATRFAWSTPVFFLGSSSRALAALPSAWLWFLILAATAAVFLRSSTL